MWTMTYVSDDFKHGKSCESSLCFVQSLGFNLEKGVGDMSRAVRFDEYGDVDVLQVVDVDTPAPGAGELLIRVKAAGINPGESKIREGLLHERWPATFPSGQGSDLAGVVEQVGDGVDGFSVGDEVIGFTDDRASQA
jgi:NADPH:quinone reductase-like Zn-dependent oxidoreductase